MTLTYQDNLIKAVSHAVLPWAIGEKLNVQSWDTQEQIDKCCNCCFAECTNCVAMEKSKGGKGNKRDITKFAELYAKGVPKNQICAMLEISVRSYYNMVKQYKGENT